MTLGLDPGPDSAGHKVVAVIWQRFGPYHLARLRGAACGLRGEPWRVVGVEVAERDHYDWVLAPQADVDRHTVFPGRAYSTLSAFSIRRGLVAALDRLQPSAVCINGWAVPEAVAALNWCTANRRRAILMSETLQSSSNPLKAVVRRQRVRRFQAALVGGRVHTDYLETMGYPRNRVEVGYDVVDNHHFGRAAPPYVDAPEKRYFLANTRFLERKGIDALLRAYAHYRRLEATPWDLVVSGSGEMERSWKGLATELGVASSVRWPGFVQYDQLPALYQSAGVFVHPAREEPWGLVVNEAAAAGLPVIVGRRVGATCELVRDGKNGALVDPDDTEAFAGTLRRMARMTTPEREAMGTLSRALVGQFGPDRFGSALRRCLLLDGTD